MSLHLTTLACCVGVPKHHICNANLMRNGADFAVYINTAQVGWGGRCSLTKFVLGLMLAALALRQTACSRSCCNERAHAAHCSTYMSRTCCIQCMQSHHKLLPLPVKEFDGSDSGARPDEAISWGKIKIDAKPVKVRHANAW